MPPKIYWKLSESTENFPKTCRINVFHEFELKTFFFNILWHFLTLPKIFGVLLYKFSKKSFQCIFVFSPSVLQSIRISETMNYGAGLRTEIYKDQ